MRKHALLDEVGRAGTGRCGSWPEKLPVFVLVPDFGHRADQHAVRPPLRRIPPARDELELADRLLRHAD